MSDSENAETLRRLIAQDEQALAALQNQEDVIVEHVAPKGFKAATSRKRVMSEMRIVEERLDKNRKRLAVLTPEPSSSTPSRLHHDSCKGFTRFA